MPQDEDSNISKSVQEDHAPSISKKRCATLYDAVAGRVSTEHFTGAPALNDFDSLPSTRTALRPEEVLFRRLHAPVRYEEDDIYFANRHLPPDQTLPDSDLLKTLHTYTSDLYASMTSDNGHAGWLSMDETALIALGILLEETATEALGETGDMVFVEGEEVTDGEASGYESEAKSLSKGRSISASPWPVDEDTKKAREKSEEISANEEIMYRYAPLMQLAYFQRVSRQRWFRCANTFPNRQFGVSTVPKRGMLSLITRFLVRTSSDETTEPPISSNPAEERFLSFSDTMGPPKSLPPAAKQALILAHLRSTRTCHTLKDLEKMLPSVASINAMQVKDYIQALADDGKIHVEKIGSGNWYWAWAGEERKAREKVRNALASDLEKVNKAVSDLEGKVSQAKEEAGFGQGAEEEAERAGLLLKKQALDAEVSSLNRELDQYINGRAGGGVDMMEADIKRCKGEAETWTDNIYILEEYLKKLTGGDREILEALQRECFGTEYIEGEGLRELQL
ncbi:hypothetical protein LOY94_006767 [Ophidiomyces ophidiicola]|nr:hypothetical protein LOZ62_006705 [Ophidiomyces ophidiicola]KAI1963536.1 hypothetical protein LOZ56_006410 [Ophidiomyces ophidiicola]KAI1998914.1 hypothetical protein LOZ50_006747 [Ophidiomyces ophidiicola]KAI2016741.1 hypothetical protein LOZ45_006557 [Ophidiomyces ophidiicola]KAI2042096.1 hypothetical protein LOZ44_006389 [Ophidiomyces ophidiicola]